jgi:hypothetical protein
MTTIGNYQYLLSYKNSNPIIPLGNVCCKETCEMLYDTIDSMEIERNHTELIKELGAYRINEQRLMDIRDSYIPILQNMSYTLTDEGICKCTENIPDKYK